MDRLFDRTEVAALLGITTETVNKICKAGGFAPSITIGQSQRWREQDLREWLDRLFNDEDRS